MAEKKGRSIPIDIVTNLRNQGYSSSQIIENLRQQNYSLQEISDAINQSEIKSSVDIPDVDVSNPPSPSMQESLEFPNVPESNMQESFQPYPSELRPSQGPMPEYQGYMGLPQRDSYTEKIEEIAESIIKEKWNDLIKDFGDIAVWKERVRTDVLSIKQEIIRINERFENLQKAVLGKVSDYDKDVKEIGTEIKALEKVLEKIIVPLTSNIKDLQKVTEEIKSKKKK